MSEATREDPLGSQAVIQKADGVEDASNQFATHVVPGGARDTMEASFGANSTALTFAGVRLEAAILTDSDEELIQI